MPDIIIKPDGSSDPSQYSILINQSETALFEGLMPDSIYRVGKIVWDEDPVSTLLPPVGEITAEIAPFTAALFDGQAIDIMINSFGDSFFEVRQPANFSISGDTIASVEVLSADLTSAVDATVLHLEGDIIDIALRVRTTGGTERIFVLQPQPVQAIQPIAVENLALTPTGILTFTLSTDGVIYILVSQDAAPMPGATIKAGGGDLDLGPLIISGGPIEQSLDVTLLSATTDYYMHITAETASGDFASDAILPFTTAVAPDSITNIVQTSPDGATWAETHAAGALVGATNDGDAVTQIISTEGLYNLDLRLGKIPPTWDQTAGLIRYTRYEDVFGITGFNSRFGDAYFAMILQRVSGGVGAGGCFIFGENGGRRSAGIYRNSNDSIFKNVSGSLPTLRVNGAVFTGTTQAALLAVLPVDEKLVVEVVGLNMLDSEWANLQFGVSVGSTQNSNLHGDFVLIPTPSIQGQTIIREELAARHGVIVS